MPDHTYPSITLDNYFDKIFYINLVKDTIRNENMIRQFAQYSIKNYERIDAINLDTVPNIIYYRNFIKTQPKYIHGQLSCRASHIKCVNIAVQRGYKKIMILEDDVVFLENPNNLLRQNSNILNDWDMLYFGGLIEPFFRNQIVCTHAYAIKESIFNDILCMAETSGMEIDNFYAKILQQMSYNLNQSGKYNIRIILPFNQIIQDKTITSNIQ
jgi:GR25 family glycosyltransferase involved in LPS biosynthesis